MAESHMMLVEDDPADATLVCAYLKGVGRSGGPLHARTLSEAQQVLEKTPVEFVLLDIHLPDGDGVRCVEALLGRVNGAPIIVLTGRDDKELALACLRAGAQDFLPKDKLDRQLLRRAIGFASARADEQEFRRRAALIKQQQDAELALRNEELIARDRQMRALAERLTQAREDERTRLSREVHDNLGQLLTGIKMDLRWLRRRMQPDGALDLGRLRDRIDEADALVDETIATVQRIALELRPTVLDALGLAAAIRDESRRFSTRTGISIVLDVSDHRGLDAKVVTTLFRIMQEMLTNVARHAQAHAVHITLTFNGDSGSLIVEDDGVGIDVSARREDAPGLGLLGMQERAVAIGGRVHIGQRGGGGTRAEAIFPL